MFAHVLVGSNQLTKCKQTLKICFDDLISVIILPTSAFFFFFWVAMETEQPSRPLTSPICYHNSRPAFIFNAPAGV